MLTPSSIMQSYMMYLHSVWQSSVQHGEDGQVGAQVRNHSTGGALTRDMEAHCPLVTVSGYVSSK